MRKSSVKMNTNKNSSLLKELHINRNIVENPRDVGDLVAAMFENAAQGSKEVIKLCFESVRDVQNWTTGYRHFIIKKYIYNDSDEKRLIPLFECTWYLLEKGYAVSWRRDPKNLRCLHVDYSS